MEAVYDLSIKTLTITGEDIKPFSETLDFDDWHTINTKTGEPLYDVQLGFDDSLDTDNPDSIKNIENYCVQYCNLTLLDNGNYEQGENWNNIPLKLINIDTDVESLGVESLDDNILIAEFMGYVIQKDPTKRFFGRYKTPITSVWIKENELAFDSDWNWLMEVVDKIDYSLTMNNGDYFQSSIGKHKTSIFRKSDLAIPYLEGEITGLGETKIESVYNACVEFIKWYNNQK